MKVGCNVVRNITERGARDAIDWAVKQILRTLL